MENSTLVKIGAVVCVAAIVFTAFVTMAGTGTSEKEQYFGLTSTKISMAAEETEEMTVWDLPGDRTYGDISWSSDNEGVATVSGGKVTAVSDGTATITAKVSYNGKEYSDSCRVTVSDSAADGGMVAYDAFSTDMDYAVLSGSGFEDGLLFLTFNYGDCLVVSLAGYDPDWLKNSGFIGNASADFSSIKMTVKDSNSRTVASSSYTNSYSNDSKPWSGILGASCNTEGYTSLIAVSGLDYGSYTVTFTLAKGNVSYNVSGSFEYKAGDGLRDATGSYYRQYAWTYDMDEDGTSEKFSPEKVTYSYGDYWNTYMKNSKKVVDSSSGVVNRTSEKECTDFITSDGSISALSEMLKTQYTKNGGTVYTGQDFAQYVLAFCQVSFDYELDSTQYYKYGDSYEDNTDIWAFATQTVASGYGDCEDTSILFASILKKLGYSTGLVILPSHMAAAVALDSYDDHGITYEKGKNSLLYCKAQEDGKTYYFCETTVKAPVTQIQSTYMSTKVTYLTSYADPGSGSIVNTYYLVGMLSLSLKGDEFTFFAD